MIRIRAPGFGGKMFALYPGNKEILCNSIEKASGETYLIKPSKGVEIF